ncbi:hypothetical protein NM208_g12679 [Fusarium decemcellulare]|uniref:Uncharacterized protein n=1 Tax=Fusarium decemcellulare TaxID=57161 RepID=A0ACC1RNX8_9HYPO|nr:hypothetical protein NM208_g12679 [Fusarium decemcellulare]
MSTSSPISDSRAQIQSELCTVCRGVFEGDCSKGWRTDLHHQSRADFRLAAERGCYICRNIVNSREWLDPNSPHNGNEFKYSIKFSGGRFQLSIYSNPDVFRHMWVFKTLPLELCRELSEYYSPPPSHQDDALVKLALQWSTSCEKSHPMCKTAFSSAFYPKRLIEIIDGERAKLVSPNQKPGHYVAFSHCWGQAHYTTTLLSSNMHALSQNIRVKTLPKSYQEAIGFCRKLGLRFIWIDSLCIMQDSNDDWKQQAPQMHQVYGNAFLNICAATAADSSGTSFTGRDARLLKPLRVEPEWVGHSNEPFGLIFDRFEDDIVSCPLRSRAWVFQEWYLSNRSLILARGQLWWHCRERIASESFPVPFGRKGNQDIRRDWHNQARGTKLQDPVARQGINWHSWRLHLENYAQTRLTRESDRLIAFSGIVQKIAIDNGVHIESQYLAGLWRSHCPRALCWFRDPQNQPQVGATLRSSEYKAPSWTWASLGGPFELHYGDMTFGTECGIVEDARVHYENHIAGTVKGGVIKIRGHLIGPGKTTSGGHFSYHDNGSDTDVDMRTSWNKIYWDEVDAAGEPMISYLDNLNPGGCEEGSVEGASRRRMYCRDAQGSFFLLPLLLTGKFSMYCILLYPDPEQPGVFYRVGYLDSHRPPDVVSVEDLSDKFPEQIILIL